MLVIASLTNSVDGSSSRLSSSTRRFWARLRLAKARISSALNCDFWRIVRKSWGGVLLREDVPPEERLAVHDVHVHDVGEEPPMDAVGEDAEFQ
jgi:hypothetical protein